MLPVTNGDKHSCHLPLYKGLHAVDSDHMIQYDVSSQHKQGRDLKCDYVCLCNRPTSEPSIAYPEPYMGDTGSLPCFHWGNGNLPLH